MRDRWRVAVIDSGLSDSARLPVVAARRFVDHGTLVCAEPLIPDPSGHGTAVIQAVCATGLATGSKSAAPGLPVPSVELLVGQVFGATGITTAATTAAAIGWALEQGASLIHMSLGLREDRRVLAEAVADAVGRGCIVVASTPARGAASYPARYAGVIRATGDARCIPGEVSVLDTVQADFGACPRASGGAAPGGASMGAAHLTGFVVARLAPGSTSESVRRDLGLMASYRGAERRSRTVDGRPIAARP